MADHGRNIYEQQRSNRNKTAVIMSAFVLFAAILGLGMDVFFLGLGSEGHAILGIPFLTLAAMGIGGWGAYNGLENGATSILTSAQAIPVDRTGPAYRQLVNVTDEMAIAAGLPAPQLYVIPDPDPNAFATGKDPEHASIAVTQGLVERMTRDELQGVIAHEMGHVRNLDIRLMTVVAALIGTVMLLSEFGTRTIRYGSGRRSSRKGAGGLVFFLLWIAALVLAPFISQILATAISRRREYLADATAAELTRNPGALAAALEKIDAADDPTRSIKKGTAHLCIADPLGSGVNEREGFWADLFATHPPVKKRILALKAMAYSGSPTPLPPAI
jgi:heat shock protein HtpX